MNNSTTELSDFQHEFTPINPYLYVLSGIISTWTLGANAVIVVCFYRNRRKQWTNFSRMTFSMTISDLLVGIVWLSIQFIGYSKRGQLPCVICTTSIFLLSSIQFVSLFHVLGICILRNRILQNPTTPKLTTDRKLLAKSTILVSWIVPLFVILVPFAALGRFSTSRIVCQLDVVFGANMRHVAMFYLTSQCLTDIVYIVTLARVWLQSKKSIGPSEPSVAMNVSTEQVCIVDFLRTNEDLPPQSMLKYQKDVMLTIGILLALFNVLTLPNTIGWFVIGTLNSTRPTLMGISNMLFVFNSALNPIVYAIRIPSIKVSIKSMSDRIWDFLHLRR